MYNGKFRMSKKKKENKKQKSKHKKIHFNRNKSYVYNCYTMTNVVGSSIWVTARCCEIQWFANNSRRKFHSAHHTMNQIETYDFRWIFFFFAFFIFHVLRNFSRRNLYFIPLFLGFNLGEPEPFSFISIH